MKSFRICRFLLCDLLVDASYLFTNAFFLKYLASVYTPDVYRNPRQVRGMAEIYLLLKDHFSDDNWDIMKLVSVDHARRLDPGLKADECLELAEAADKGCESLWAFPWYEICVPRYLPMIQSLSRERWLLDLFLARDGDPNMRSPSGQGLPLQAALDITTCCLPKRWPVVEGFIMRQHSSFMEAYPEFKDMYMVSNPRLPVGFIRLHVLSILAKTGEVASFIQNLCRWIRGSDRPVAVASIACQYTVPPAMISNHAACFLEMRLRELGVGEGPADCITDPSEPEGEDPLLLLVPLMESGADVHAIVTEECGKTQCSMADYAQGLGLEDVWNNALERCGYDPGAVKAESDRRLAHARRLNEGNASGIDTSSLELPDVSGLRRRRTSGRDQTP